MTYEDIVKKAQDSYSRYFRKVQEINDTRTNDAVVDKDKVNDVIKQGEGHLENIKAIRKELEDEALEAEEKTFGKEEAKSSIDKIEDDYNTYQAKLKEFANKMEEIREEHE